MRTRTNLLLIAFAAICLALMGCSTDNPTEPVSEPVPEPTPDLTTFGNGTIQSWVQLDDAGNPISIGVTFTEDMLSGFAERRNVFLPGSCRTRLPTSYLTMYLSHGRR